jgi:sulfite reductase (NADPH) hemoprotein beta-component
MACVALNTCPLALAEGQRYLPDLITKIEPIMAKHKIENNDISLRMTGCPNGCARPFLAEIGLVGKSMGKYNLYLGASAVGERLNTLYKESLGEEEILSELDSLFGQYTQNKKTNETFGDFSNRTFFNN